MCIKLFDFLPHIFNFNVIFLKSQCLCAAHLTFDDAAYVSFKISVIICSSRNFLIASLFALFSSSPRSQTSNLKLVKLKFFAFYTRRTPATALSTFGIFPVIISNTIFSQIFQIVSLSLNYPRSILNSDPFALIGSSQAGFTPFKNIWIAVT